MAFPAPPLEASQGGVQAAATAWTWAGVVPSLQKGGRFRRQPWKTAGERVTFAQGCSPAGIQEPPPPGNYSGFGNAKKEKNPEEQNVPRARRRILAPQELPGRVAFH